jgi:hypothetical protein
MQKLLVGGGKSCGIVSVQSVLMELSELWCGFGIDEMRVCYIKVRANSNAVRRERERSFK